MWASASHVEKRFPADVNFLHVPSTITKRAYEKS
jgi:hypothetical protein